MHLLIASDIFGKTVPFQNLCNSLETRLKNRIQSCKLTDPYLGQSMNFESESLAYEHFISTGGIQAYATILSKNIREQIPPDDCRNLLFIGFSAGASAFWYLSGQTITGSNPIDPVRKAVLFYPSRISEVRHIRLSFETELIFPCCEPGYEVDQLIGELGPIGASLTPSITPCPGAFITAEGNSPVRCVKTPFLHGFMNELSPNYDASGYEAFVSWLISSTGRA
ncbi:MAG: hypothetical protein D3926_24970 [Desulfobacteraceae bacterium]|nr:MAG: hypothetical protein D3926_24970 [Desulfobacteraceae bacterium]